MVSYVCKSILVLANIKIQLALVYQQVTKYVFNFINKQLINSKSTISNTTETRSEVTAVNVREITEKKARPSFPKLQGKSLPQLVTSKESYQKKQA